jgi:hypothetical protein
LLAKVRIGKLLDDIPKESGGDRKSNKFKSSSAATFETKEQGKRTDLELIDNSVDKLTQELK